MLSVVCNLDNVAILTLKIYTYTVNSYMPFKSMPEYHLFMECQEKNKVV